MISGLQLLADYALGFVCLSVCNQDVSKTNLWMFAKFPAGAPHMSPCKQLCYGAAILVSIRAADR